MKYLMTIAMALLIGGVTIAQEGKREKTQGEKGEKMEQLYRAFLETELDLSDQEAEQFWPIYDDWRTKTKSIKKEIRKTKKNNSDVALTEQEMRMGIEKRAQLEHQLIDDETSFLKKTLVALGPEKTERYIRAKKKFKTRVLGKVREGRGERPSER